MSQQSLPCQGDDDEKQIETRVPEEQNRELIQRLAERVKELAALHRAARILQDESKSVPQLLQELVELLPPALQYPEVTAARITLGSTEFKTSNFIGTPWSQRVEFTAGNMRGALEVVYLDEVPEGDKGLFLQEEKNLLNSLAEMITSAMNREYAQEALRESERRLRDMLTNIEMIAVMADMNGDITFCNDYLLRLTGWKREEAIGRNWFELFLPEDEKEKVREILIGVEPAGEVTIHLANAIKTRSGERRLVKWTNTTLRGLNGKIIGVAALGDDITERKAAEEQLRASSEQLRALSERLRRAKEEEGKRIARELHDELGSALTSLKWGLLGLKEVCLGKQSPEGPATMGREIEQMIALVDETVNTVRRISSELRPSMLDDLGVVAAIEWQTLEFHKRSGIQSDFDSVAENATLDREQDAELFRVFQEALTNILRHAGATKVNVLIDEDDGQLVLEVRDNGRGITEMEKHGARSLGLLGMRERVKSIGGEIEIIGEPGKGTRLTVRIPMKADALPGPNPTGLSVRAKSQ
jgi:PAS domain S-box-containing protein